MALASAAAGAAAAQNFTYGSWLPASEYVNRVALPKAFREIEEETQGLITWRLVPGGQLVNLMDTWDAVGSGLVQGGIGRASDVASAVPALDAVYRTVLPGDETLAAGGASLETLLLDCLQCREELRDLGMVVLAGWTAAPDHLGCTTPVRSVDNLAGLRVQASGGNVRLIEHGGATAVTASPVEALELLQDADIDCVFGTVEQQRRFGLGDVITHYTDYPLGMTGPTIGWMMNRDAWNVLSDEDKELHLRKGAMVSAMQIGGHFVEEERAALDWAVGEKGVELVQADDAAFAALMEDFLAAQDQAVIAAAEAQGVANPGEIISTYRGNFERWKDLVRSVETAEQFEQLLWDEVYAWLDFGTF
ncbi:type 2 periplasmic-binding domain-containing protein [Roseitranquillus sediminis]|uniref:hypothetical protein n=1 Tax=Roseitranquillus sediminis TaxID=2809051 RepID=UPI001D0C2EC7|nr:hypothetical protein [Roseitranquillus sediminis]MBM9593066.1 hypothetical protein [Roseitranquillus sediminis]